MVREQNVVGSLRCARLRPVPAALAALLLAACGGASDPQGTASAPAGAASAAGPDVGTLAVGASAEWIEAETGD